MNETAKGAGLWGAICAAVGNILAAPQNADIVLWLCGLIITGLFGIASASVAVYLKWRLERRDKKSRTPGRDDGGDVA